MSLLKKEDKNHKWLYGIGIAILCVVAAFISMVGLYFHKFDRTLEAENEAHLAETAAQITAHTLSIVKDTRTALRLAAKALPAIDDNEEIHAYLARVAEEMGFAYMGYAQADGIFHSDIFSETKDLSDEDYFQKAMAGETVITGLQRTIMEDKAVSGIILAAPVYQSFASQPDGVLTAMLDIRRLQKVLNVSSFSGNGYAYLIDSEGELVLHTKSMDYNNFFTLLNNVAFQKGYSRESALSDIRNGRQGMILYDNLGTSQYAYYRPLGFNGWTVVNIVARDAVTANTAVLTKELAVLSVITVAVFITLILIAVVIFIISERQRQGSEMKSVFLANMSHELRTPMNAIVGISELLSREELTQTQQDYVQVIKRSSGSLLTIINDILDFSKLQSGRFSLFENRYSLSSLITDVTTLTVIRIGEKPIRFFVDLDEQLPSHLIGDATRLKQILINLLGNAVKFTNQGLIRLTIRCDKTDATARLTMVVEDTGIGIQKQELDQLFVSFSRLDTHHNHAIEGTGLGLAITKQLVESMGGSVSVTSTFGAGSAFTVTVNQKTDGSALLLDVNDLKKLRLAVFESDDTMFGLLEEVLKRFKIPGRIFHTAEAALSEIASDSYDYVLGGHELLSRLDSEEQSQTCIPVLLAEQKEDPLYRRPDGQFTIYKPLFCLELSRLLDSGREPSIEPAEFPFDPKCVQRFPEAHVLIVDDNEINLDVAEALMAPYQIKIDRAVSGREALELVGSRSYQIIFMDHMMPDMDGVETLHLIRTLKDQTKRSIPVVALTANATLEAQNMFRSEGFDGFLAKPLEPEKLDAAIRRFLA